MKKDEVNIGRYSALWKNRKINWALVAFITIFCVCFIFSCIRNVVEFYHDSRYYWEIAEPVVSEGFDILNFLETFRGYFYPVFLQIVRLVGEKLFGQGYWGLRLLSSGMIACFFARVLPDIFQKRIDGLRPCIRIIGVVIVVLYFWGDFLQYPLSDFPALFFLCCGIALLFQRKEKPGIIRFVTLGGGRNMPLFSL